MYSKNDVGISKEMAIKSIDMCTKNSQNLKPFDFISYKNLHFKMFKVEEEESSPGLLGRLGQARNGFTR